MKLGGNLKSIDLLSTVTVVDLTRVFAGPYCTQMLGDLGAKVIKIEPPAGDMTRSWGAPLRHGVNPYYAGLNRNKLHTSFDLSTPGGRKLLRTLLQGADVLVENFRVDTMSQWGIGPETLLKEFPNLVYCKITGFGNSGPLRDFPAYDATLQAFSGIMEMTGEPDSGPGKIPMPLIDITTGQLALSGILAALYERHTTGKGQLVEVNLLSSALSLLHPAAANLFATGANPERIGTAHSNIAPYQVIECGDTALFVAAGTEREFQALSEVLGSRDLPADPQFATNVARVENRALLADRLEKLTAQRLAESSADQILSQLQARGVPSTLVRPLSEVFEDPQVIEQKMVAEVDGWKTLALPIAFNGKRQNMQSGPKPLGTDTIAVLRNAGLTESEIEAALDSGSAIAGSLPAPSRESNSRHSNGALRPRTGGTVHT